jgi:hypothetical protein
MIIYTGKGTKFDDEYKGLPQSTQIIMTLMKPLFSKGYCLTVDKYYNSPQLADLLIAQKSDMYGTVRPSRKFMPSGFRSKTIREKSLLFR